MSETPHSFALAAISTIKELADVLSKEEGVTLFYSVLHYLLTRVSGWLGNVRNARSDSEERTVQTLRLLKTLEKHFQRPSRYQLSPSRHLATEMFQTDWFPTLNEIQKDQALGKRILRNIALGPKTTTRRARLLLSLRQYRCRSDDPKGPGLAAILPERTPEDPKHDCQSEITDLYNIVSSKCICKGRPSSEAIQVNLRLRRIEEVIDEVNDYRNQTRFGILLLDHPHQQQGDDICHWQDTQICVARKGPSPLPSDVDKMSNIEGLDLEFCQYISARQRVQLRFEIRNGSLATLTPGPISREFHTDASSVPLSDILAQDTKSKLEWKKRLLLACQLSEAVWQFCDTKWMLKEWNKYMVQFMFERHKDVPEAIFLNEPFLSAKLEESKESNEREDLYGTHVAPKALALGIMLLEIELGVMIEDYYPENYDSKKDLLVITNHMAACAIFDDPGLWTETRPAFKKLIGICLTPEAFRPHMRGQTPVRDIIYKHIVRPLREMYKLEFQEYPEKSEVHPIDMGYGGFKATACTRSRMIRGVPSRVDPVSDCSMADVRASDKWFDQYEKLKTIVRLTWEHGDNLYEPVKIAILDSGISKDLYGSSELIAGYKDFIDSAEADPQDEIGHGSQVFRLFQRLYRELEDQARVYIGRVWQNRIEDFKAASLMTKAIWHAKNEWKADIIVVPSGFPHEVKNMQNAIEEANAIPTLIFAAASNDANLTEIAFPARLYGSGKVFCMFSTGANAKSISEFNPSPLEKAKYSFAILGENINLGSDLKLSGTSFSTVVGAALAGLIIDFSRHADTRRRIHNPEHLKRVEGMAAVFAKMAKPNAGYQCLAPWILLPEMEREEDVLQPENRSKVRERVVEVISEALRQTYK